MYIGLLIKQYIFPQIVKVSVLCFKFQNYAVHKLQGICWLYFNMQNIHGSYFIYAMVNISLWT